MNVAVDCLAAAVIALQRKRTHTVFLDHQFENIQLELLELDIAMRGLAQSDDADGIGDGDVGDVACVFRKFLGINWFYFREAAEVSVEIHPSENAPKCIGEQHNQYPAKSVFV